MVDILNKILKVFFVFIMILGLVFILHPLFLIIDSALTQHRLEKEFTEGNTSKPEVKKKYPYRFSADYWFKAPEVPVLDIETLPPELYEFPPTKLVIPEIDMSAMISVAKKLSDFEAITTPPGYYPQSDFPGMGNVLIAGHRGGPAGYFRYLNKLREGDLVILNIPGYSYHYIVESVYITDRHDWSITELDYDSLTLTTCEAVGRNTSAKRLVVRSRLERVIIN